MQRLAMYILRHIRKIYIELHQGTDAAPTVFDGTTDDRAKVLFYPSSYPSCRVPEHGTYTHEATASPIGGTTHACDPISHILTPTAPAVPSSFASHQSHPTGHVAYGVTYSGVPDASQRTTQVVLLSHTILARVEGHLPLAASRDALARVTTQSATDFLTTSLTPDTVLGHIPPAESDPLSSSSPSRFYQTLTSPQANPNVADRDVPIPVEAPHHDQHQTSRPGSDVVINVSLGAAPLPHDVDRSQ